MYQYKSRADMGRSDEFRDSIIVLGNRALLGKLETEGQGSLFTSRFTQAYCFKDVIRESQIKVF